MIYVGIDPGLHGGLAALTLTGEVRQTVAMPVAAGEIDAGRLGDILCDWQILYGEITVSLEKVGAMPGQGVTSMFKFGTGWGMVRGVCAALGMPVTLVTPTVWKKTVLIGLPHDKDGAVQFCRSRWPTVDLVQRGCRKPHDGIADALCLAEYGRMTHCASKRSEA